MQFRGNPLLSPRDIRTSHGRNELLEIHWDWGSAERPPEEAQSVTVQWVSGFASSDATA